MMTAKEAREKSIPIYDEQVDKDYLELMADIEKIISKSVEKW